MWDSLDPAWLDRAVSWLAGHGYRPLILVERQEEPVFRELFAKHGEFGGLDWPPIYDIDRQVRIFDPADRARYLAGQRVATEHVWRED
jgi:hypothetical protein